MVQAGITPTPDDFASLIASYGNAAQVCSVCCCRVDFVVWCTHVCCTVSLQSHPLRTQPPADFVTTILDLVERSKLVTVSGKSTQEGGQAEEELSPMVVNAAIKAFGTQQYVGGWGIVWDAKELYV